MSQGDNFQRNIGTNFITDDNFLPKLNLHEFHKNSTIIENLKLRTKNFKEMYLIEKDNNLGNCL